MQLVASKVLRNRSREEIKFISYHVQQIPESSSSICIVFEKNNYIASIRIDLACQIVVRNRENKDKPDMMLVCIKKKIYLIKITFLDCSSSSLCRTGNPCCLVLPNQYYSSSVTAIFLFFLFPKRLLFCEKVGSDAFLQGSLQVKEDVVCDPHLGTIAY